MRVSLKLINDISVVIAKTLLDKHYSSIDIDCYYSLEILGYFSLEVFVVVFVVD